VQLGPPGAYIVDSRGVRLEDDHFRLFAEGDRPEVRSYTRDQSCINKSHVDAKEEFQILDYQHNNTIEKIMLIMILWKVLPGDDRSSSTPI
jgi:hypothetical protein